MMQMLGCIQINLEKWLNERNTKCNWVWNVKKNVLMYKKVGNFTEQTKNVTKIGRNHPESNK